MARASSSAKQDPEAPVREPRPERTAKRLAAALRGALQTIAIVGLFVSAGLVASGLAGRFREAARTASEPATQGLRPYPDTLMDRTCPTEQTPRRWLVDGFNVLHSGILRGRNRGGWWQEQPRQQLLARAARFDAGGAEVWVVFDGARTLPEAEDHGGLQVVFAASADAWLLRQVREAEDPARLAVVTADRRLADRARHRGARVVTPAAFLARCQPA